jgi:hypothetical protein
VLNAVEVHTRKALGDTGHNMPDHERLARIDLAAIIDRILIERGGS